METLPLELLTLVGQTLQTEHQPSLISFALTSKRCYAAATKELFRNIQITITTPNSLKSDVVDILHALKSSGSLKHVRKLSIGGSMQDCKNTLLSHEPSQECEGQSESTSPPYYNPQDPFDEDWIRQPSHKVIRFDDSLWSPLATLIEQLPSLAIVDYSCDDQISSCILCALECHSNIQLQLRLNSGSNLDLNRHTRAILTSPLLSCITVHRNRQTEIEEAITGSLMATIDPTLKEVRIICGPASHRQYAQDQPLLPWYGRDDAPAKGALRVLRFSGRRLPDSQDLLQSWHRRTDLSVLEVLDLRCHFGIQALHWATSNLPFKALTDLYIQTELFPAYDPDYHRAAKAFVLSLPPLRGLSLRGIPGLRCLSPILSHHGSKLRRLHFRPVRSAVPTRCQALSQVEVISDLCPNLQHLAFHIHRTKGDAREVSIYKALGRMHNLISLDLTLDATVLSGTGSFNAYGRIPNLRGAHVDEGKFRLPFQYSPSTCLLNGHVCENLINSAIDAKLAKSIFRIIASNKRPKSPPLQVLKIRIIGGGIFGSSSPAGIDTVMKEIARSWIVIPSPRGDEVGTLVATELAPRWSRDESLEPEPLLEHIEQVFRWVWPIKGYGDWTDEWDSFPLAEV